MNKTLKTVLLWLLAVVLTISMAIYQRATGPTYPVDGSVTLGDTPIDYTLHRSHELHPEKGMDHTVEIPAPVAGMTGELYYKRLGIDEPFTAVAMTREDGMLTGDLPAQPEAGKLVYHIELEDPAGNHAAIPSESETVTIRFKGRVSEAVLTPHILAMFLALLFTMRALLAVIFREKLTHLAWLTLGFFFVGGLILGPFVQKAAFGDYWTGWPFGGDVTDNKVALAFIAWLAAVLRLNMKDGERKARMWVLIACLVMFSIYLIPHSLGGSTFNYETGAVDTGL